MGHLYAGLHRTDGRTVCKLKGGEAMKVKTNIKAGTIFLEENIDARADVL